MAQLRFTINYSPIQKGSSHAQRIRKNETCLGLFTPFTFLSYQQSLAVKKDISTRASKWRTR